MIPRITLQLLDSAQGHPLQTWTFEDKDEITLGRSGENDIVLADPYVSRAHAFLKYEESGWRLTSISSRLIVLEGQAWRDVPLVAGAVFRLGPNGCFLRFVLPQDQATNSATMSYDPTLMPIFKLDADTMQREVSQIADGQYFQQLKSATRHLRQRRAVEQGGR
jgi:hypothetical protein